MSPDLETLRRTAQARPGDIGARVDLLLALAGTPEGAAVLDETAQALRRTWSLGQPEFDGAVMRACERLADGLPDGPERAAVRILAASLLLQRIATAPDAVDTLKRWLEPFAHGSAEASEAQQVAAAELLVGAGCYGEARTALARCASRGATVVALEALLDLAEGAVDAALARLTPALAIAPDDVALLAAGASALMRAGRPDDAVVMLEHALAQAGDRVDLWVNLISAHVLAGRVPLAMGLVDGLVERLGPVPMLVALQNDIAASLA